MRALGLLACGLLLAACVSRTGPASRPSTAPLTAAAAFGDLTTIDYCSLLTGTGTDPLSSFELCRAGVDSVEVTVGPLATDHVTAAYDYPDDLPPGVRVRTAAREAHGCALWVGFADGVRLRVAAVDAAEPPWSAEGSYCRAAAAVVGGVLAAVADGRVRHRSYPPGSFGGVDPCPLIAAFGSEPEPAPSGHACVNGRVALSFGIDRRGGGEPAVVGGRAATVRRDPGGCRVVFARPVDQTYAEQATVTVRGDDACTLALAAAERVAPGVPQ